MVFEVVEVVCDKFKDYSVSLSTLTIKTRSPLTSVLMALVTRRTFRRKVNLINFRVENNLPFWSNP